MIDLEGVKAKNLWLLVEYHVKPLTDSNINSIRRKSLSETKGKNGGEHMILNNKNGANMFFFLPRKSIV